MAGRLDPHEGKAWWDDSTQGVRVREIPPKYWAAEEVAQKCWAAAEANDELGRKYLEGKELSVDEIGGCANALGTNCLTCAARRSEQRACAMLDAIVDFMPAPTLCTAGEARTLTAKNPQCKAGGEKFSGSGVQNLNDPFPAKA